MSFAAPKVRKDRVTIACQNCRQRKVRCMEPLVSPSFSSLTTGAGSGGSPCTDCTRLRKPCVYPALERRKRRKRKDSDHLRPTRILGSPDDVLVPTQLLNAAAPTPPSPSNRPQRPEILSVRSTAPGDRLSTQPRATAFAHSPLAPESVSTSDAGIGKIPPPWESNDYVMQESAWEYHEPWSWLSICSEVGSRWVCGVTQSNEFGGIARRFAKEFARRTTIGNTPSLTPISSDVDEETAWKYVDGKQQTLKFHPAPLLSREIRSFLRTMLGG